MIAEEGTYTGRPRVILSLPPGAPRLRNCQYSIPPILSSSIPAQRKKRHWLGFGGKRVADLRDLCHLSGGSLIVTLESKMDASLLGDVVVAKIYFLDLDEKNETLIAN